MTGQARGTEIKSTYSAQTRSVLNKTIHILPRRTSSKVNKKETEMKA